MPVILISYFNCPQKTNTSKLRNGCHTRTVKHWTLKVFLPVSINSCLSPFKNFNSSPMDGEWHTSDISTSLLESGQICSLSIVQFTGTTACSQFKGHFICNLNKSFCLIIKFIISSLSPIAVPVSTDLLSEAFFFLFAVGSGFPVKLCGCLI